MCHPGKIMAKMSIFDKITIKVNLVSLVKFVRKFMKWRKQHLINDKDVSELVQEETRAGDRVR